MARDAEPLQRAGQRGFAHLGRAAAAPHLAAGHGRRRSRRTARPGPAPGSGARSGGRSSPSGRRRRPSADTPHLVPIACPSPRFSSERKSRCGRYARSRPPLARAVRLWASTGPAGPRTRRPWPDRGPRVQAAQSPTAKTSSRPDALERGADPDEATLVDLEARSRRRPGARAAPATQTTAAAASRSPPSRCTASASTRATRAPRADRDAARRRPRSGLGAAALAA